MYSDRQAWANSVDPVETPQNAASHQGLHCLPLIQQFLDTNCICSNFRTSTVRSWAVQILRVNTVLLSNLNLTGPDTLGRISAILTREIFFVTSCPISNPCPKRAPLCSQIYLPMKVYLLIFMVFFLLAVVVWWPFAPFSPCPAPWDCFILWLSLFLNNYRFIAWII